MCNACGFLCCALDTFDGCGCDTCGEDDCLKFCETCGEPESDCLCDQEDDCPLEYEEVK